MIDLQGSGALLIVSFTVLLSAAMSGPAAAQSDAPPGPPKRLWLYFGTYTNTDAKSRGIYLGHLDLATGRLESVELAGETTNPSFLAVHPTRGLLYCVGEMSNFEGKGTGAVNAFSIQPKTGKLTLLNQQSSGGSGPCHVTIDRTGRYVLVANYGSGSVACLPIQGDGRLAAASCVVQHCGSSVYPQRQTGPHAHAIYLDPANRIALAADLGMDKILVYCFNADCGKLGLNRPAWVAAQPGAGPRHLAFHPNGRWLFCINELDNTVTRYCYDAGRGELRPCESLSTLPEGFQGTNTAAEIAVHPSGKFLYGSNRGHNSVAIFAIDAETGKLRQVGHQSTQGKTPRYVGIDPAGRYLLAAHQDTNNVVIFRIDAATGQLQPTGPAVEVPAAVCIEMIKPLE
ncbi:MAG: lactonase family protein [Thermoguttaceae bacterium]|jgi:6-phosphogluconolactonase